MILTLVLSFFPLIPRLALPPEPISQPSPPLPEEAGDQEECRSELKLDVPSWLPNLYSSRLRKEN